MVFLFTLLQTKTVHRLAAAHRAALRTLANYQGHPSQHIPPELALLLLQLNLMSSKLGVCEGNDLGLQQAIQQVMVSQNKTRINYHLITAGPLVLHSLIHCLTETQRDLLRLL